VQVGDHEEAVVCVLHPHVIFQCAEIVSEVEIARAPDSAHDDLPAIVIFHKEAKIRETEVTW
jgi:hypothetical protein